MAYSVIGADGKEYGPVEVAQLQAWLAEGRLHGQTPVKDFMTGQTMVLSQVPGLNIPGNQPPVAPPAPGQPVFTPGAGPYAAPQPGFMPNYGVQTAPVKDHSIGDLLLIIFISAMGLVFFFFLHGIGLLIGASSILRAFKLNANGSKYGVAALVISILAFVAIGIGWIVRAKTLGQ